MNRPSINAFKTQEALKYALHECHFKDPILRIYSYNSLNKTYSFSFVDADKGNMMTILIEDTALGLKPKEYGGIR